MKTEYPVTLEVEYPERLSRLLIFVKWLLAIPHLIVLYFYGIIVGVITFFAWWAILFTGRYPKGMFDVVVDYLRWNLRVSAYMSFLTDSYPPFSGSE